MNEMPHIARPFANFATRLRGAGFPVAPEQTISFLSGIELLGPRSIVDVRRAAHATFAPSPERRAEFDAVFDAHFLDAVAVTYADEKSDSELLSVSDPEMESIDLPSGDELNESGEAASVAEQLTARGLGTTNEKEILRKFARELPSQLPQRRGYRAHMDRRGKIYQLRHSLREAVKYDGEIFDLPRLRRKVRQRRVLLLIDVSGSMKGRTDAHIDFAHAIAGAVDEFEGFTIGTRLTRVTKALRIKNPSQACVAASNLVADWDGGTRIGDALQAFLAMPRFAGYARGALVLMVSDGLERGDPTAMRNAVSRLTALAWRVLWLSPLAGDPRYRPETDAIRAILPLVKFADGGSIERLCEQVLQAQKLNRDRAVRMVSA